MAGGVSSRRRSTGTIQSQLEDKISAVAPSVSDDSPTEVGTATPEVTSRIDHGHKQNDQDRHELNLVDGLAEKVADIDVEPVTNSWANVGTLSDGGFSTFGSKASLTLASGLTYHLTCTATAGDASHN